MFLKTRVFCKNKEWFFTAGEGDRAETCGPYKTMRGAEIAQASYIRKNQGNLDGHDKRLEGILEDIGVTCCRMAFKLSYVSGCPVQEVGQLLGLDEEQAERAIQAGEYSLGYLKAGTAVRLTKFEVEQAVGKIFE